MTKDLSTDVTIIGGGPVGLYAAFYCGMRQMSVKIIESLPQLGGQLAALYPEKNIYDVAGTPKIAAQKLVDQLIEQIQTFKQTICLNETVQNVEKQEDGTFILTTNLTTHHSKAIIITAGNGAFSPKRLEIENAKTYENKNLHYFVGDIKRFTNKNVVLFGGGDSAVDWSLMLEPIAKSVTVVHRREDFRAHEHSVELLKASNVDIKTPYVPVEIIGNEEKITHVVLSHVEDKTQETLEIDDIIVTYGFVFSLGQIKEWGLEIDKNCIVVDQNRQTSIPGIFACGDICTYDGKVKLITAGFGEVPQAVNKAKQYVDPTAKIGHLRSTNMKF